MSKEFYYCDTCDWDEKIIKRSYEDCISKGHVAAKLTDHSKKNKVMKNEIKLILIKNEAGITAANEAEGTIDLFDETEEARQDFIKYMVEEFINKEVLDGKKYR